MHRARVTLALAIALALANGLVVPLRAQDAGFKPVSTLVHNLVDNVSKNGYLLLNVGPNALRGSQTETKRGPIGRLLHQPLERSGSDGASTRERHRIEIRA